MLNYPPARLAAACALLAGCWPPAHADLVVLQYHHISDSAPASTSTGRDLFEDQLNRIRELELEVVSLHEATEQALTGDLEQEQRIALTFDDAYDSVWETAAPILEQRGYPYTIFVNTDAVGRPGYMTWAQLREASQRDGVLIANHSHDHGHLARRPEEGAQEWQRRVSHSLDQAAEFLEQKLGTTEPLFAYPYGEYDEALEALLEDRGWYGYGQQSGAIGASSKSTRLPRFPMATSYGQPDTLTDKLNSRALPVDAAELPESTVDANPPRLVLTLPANLKPSALNCFATGQGQLDVKHQGQQVTVLAPKPFSSRRFRYNCTYPAGDGTFYWLSQQWVDLEQPED